MSVIQYWKIFIVIATVFIGITSSAADCDRLLTSTQALGPYYTQGSPERSDLIDPEIKGKPLRVTGKVVNQDCQPMAGVKLDFWQTDGEGKYDNQGYRLRGHLFTDEQGEYALQTVMPGYYPGRPAHIHVVVLSPAGKHLLTTQIYFTDDNNEHFPSTLIAKDQPPGSDGVRRVEFDFVIGK